MDYIIFDRGVKQEMFTDDGSSLIFKDERCFLLFHTGGIEI